MAGMDRLSAGQAVACALHLIDPTTGQYDASATARHLPGLDIVVIEWARREQGLIVAPGNPVEIRSVSDLRNRVRVAMRQEGSGGALLLSKLVADAGFAVTDLKIVGEPVSSETDVAVAVREGKADAGLAIEAAAREHALDFIPLQWERFDIVVRRVEYFEAPLQRLFAFARSKPFRERASLLGGYDVTNTGAVMFNARR
jgi:molybdate-binding protein